MSVSAISPSLRRLEQHCWVIAKVTKLNGRCLVVCGSCRLSRCANRSGSTRSPATATPRLDELQERICKERKMLAQRASIDRSEAMVERVHAAAFQPTSPVKVLCATNALSRSDAAVTRARAIARELNAELHLVHVVDST